MKPAAKESICPHGSHQQCIAQALQTAEALCARQGKRFTPIRRRVLEMVWAQHRPIGAYDLLARFSHESHRAPATIYRALEFLLQLGLIHRVESLNAYIGCNQPQKNHSGQFLICNSCRQLTELNNPQLQQAIEDSANGKDFTPEEQTVEIFGICASCRQKSAPVDG